MEPGRFQVLNRLTDKSKYDKRLRPRYGEGHVDVGITIHVSSISAVSEVDMDFTLDFYLRYAMFHSVGRLVEDACELLRQVGTISNPRGNLERRHQLLRGGGSGVRQHGILVQGY